MSTNAIGVVDVALWDLAGKTAGLLIHRLLGTCCDRVPAYASPACLPTPEAYGFALVEDIEVDDKGLVYAPEKPGLGHEIDWQLVRRETAQVVR